MINEDRSVGWRGSDYKWVEQFTVQWGQSGPTRCLPSSYMINSLSPDTAVPPVSPGSTNNHHLSTVSFTHWTSQVNGALWCGVEWSGGVLLSSYRYCLCLCVSVAWWQDTNTLPPTQPTTTRESLLQQGWAQSTLPVSILALVASCGFLVLTICYVGPQNIGLALICGPAKPGVSDKCTDWGWGCRVQVVLPTLLPAGSRHTTVHHSQQSNIKTTYPGVS